jgi:hypothetical protein
MRRQQILILRGAGKIDPLAPRLCMRFVRDVRIVCRSNVWQTPDCIKSITIQGERSDRTVVRACQCGRMSIIHQLVFFRTYISGSYTITVSVLITPCAVIYEVPTLRISVKRSNSVSVISLIVVVRICVTVEYTSSATGPMLRID